MTYLDFLGRILIPTPEPKLFTDVAFTWQLDDAQVLEQIIERATSKHAVSVYRNACIIRPRGCDKTSSIARLSLWTVAFKRDFITRGYACAVDEEQAKLIAESAAEMLLLNDWLRQMVKISVSKPTRISGPGGVIRIMSSDDSSSWGKKPTLVIFDELTHWETPKSKRFFNAIWSSLPKNPRSACIIISNAGYVGTWQHELVKSLSERHDWYVDNKPGRPQSWITDEQLAPYTLGMEPNEIRRVYYNEWVERTGTSLQSLYSQVATGIENEVGSSYINYYIGVDYGYSDSLTAIAVCHEDNGIIIVNTVKAYKHLSLSELEKILLDVAKNFPNHIMYADQFQMLYLIERLQQQGVNIQPIKPTKQLNDTAISLLVNRMKDKTIVLPLITGVCENKSLADEMAAAQIINGKIETSTNKDRIMALCYALLAHMQNPLNCNIDAIKAKLTQGKHTIHDAITAAIAGQNLYSPFGIARESIIRIPTPPADTGVNKWKQGMPQS
jgi:phage terminase large subunit-like protein